MAQIMFNNDYPIIKKRQEDKIQQGDLVFCDANGSGARSFWGIYGQDIGVVSLDGGGNTYIPKDRDIYLGDTYTYWTITKRILNDKAVITIEEK